MNIKSFIETKEYQELKNTMLDEFSNKIVKIKTDGKTNEMIATELKAMEIASKKLLLALSRFERKAVAETPIKQVYR